MTDKYYVAISEKMAEREGVAAEFYHAIFDPEEVPYIVTDEASLYDIYIGEEIELIKKVKEKYGVTLTKKDFKIPFGNYWIIWRKKDMYENLK